NSASRASVASRASSVSSKSAEEATVGMESSDGEWRGDTKGAAHNCKDRWTSSRPQTGLNGLNLPKIRNNINHFALSCWGFTPSVPRPFPPNAKPGPAPMSFQSPALPHFRLSPILTELARWTGRISVRARIVVLALIPVIGFLANGFTYVAGEGEVGHSFATVNR